jgi:hypothetical protein
VEISLQPRHRALSVRSCRYKASDTGSTCGVRGIDGSEAFGNIDGTALRQLDASDLEMARITEDLIDLLIGRNIINFTDFPGMAQAKFINRRALRSNMSALTNLVGDEENIF